LRIVLKQESNDSKEPIRGIESDFQSCEYPDEHRHTLTHTDTHTQSHVTEHLTIRPTDLRPSLHIDIGGPAGGVLYL